MERINVLYSADESKKDYTRYLGVSIISLLENNKNENIYILSQYIEESNKQELIKIVRNYGKNILFSEGEIIPEKYKNLLIPTLHGIRPLATYYRWFFGNCFKIQDRLLYLDCDTIIVNNISEFYNSDFQGNIFIGNLETPTTCYSRKKKYGLNTYINGGVYLVNIDKFKKINMYDEIIKVNNKYGDVDYVDQDYVNLIFKDRIKLYKNLQCLVYFKWINYTISNYLVLHTLRKPNVGRYGNCPKNIENLFNKYLEKTKRKKYIGYKGDKPSIAGYFWYCYFYFYSSLEYIALITLGGKYSYYVKFGINGLMHHIGKILRNVKKIFV